MVLTVNGGHRDSHGSLTHHEVAFTYKHQHSSLIVLTEVTDNLTHPYAFCFGSFCDQDR